MQKSKFRKTLVLVALGALAVDAAHAFNFGNMMNPSRWWGGDDDRYDDDYYGAPPYGYGYPAPGYAAPGYVQPGYAVPAYPAPGYPAPGYAPGYAAPGYAAPTVSAPAPAPAPAPATAPAPAPASTEQEGADESEIARLKQRISELEAAGDAAAPPAAHPYEQDYRFPDSGAAASGRAAAAPPASSATPEYPVYSPFGPPAEFPPLAPDDESVTPIEVEAIPAPPAATPPPAQEAAAPSDSPVTISPYGNPANYVPPVQDIGQRVYEFGR